MSKVEIVNTLVTGGAGFIGSHLAERLIQQKHNVTVIDNLSTGSPGNIRKLDQYENFEFVKADIRDSNIVNSLIRKTDLVFHLAAAVGVRLIAEQPVYTIETNVTGTQTILEAANKFNKRILVASSSEVYGKNENVPFAEDDDILLGSTRFPRWAYACTKAIDEFLALAFHQQYGLEVIITRFFNTIGPRQTGRYGMVVPAFVNRALKNEPLLIHGTGKQTRCFCYVQDLVNALVELINSDNALGNVYNVGSTEEISIENLADKIITLTNSKSIKQYVPYEQAYGKPMEDMMRRVPDTKKIQQQIKWKPKLDLKQALKLIIQDAGTNL